MPRSNKTAPATGKISDEIISTDCPLKLKPRQNGSRNFVNSKSRARQARRSGIFIWPGLSSAGRFNFHYSNCSQQLKLFRLSLSRSLSLFLSIPSPVMRNETVIIIRWRECSEARALLTSAQERARNEEFIEN